MVRKVNYIVVFARAPRPGTVKTRLVAHFGTEAATALYRAMLHDCLALAQTAAREIEACQVCVAFTPADAFAPGPHSLTAFWNGERMPQSDGDLGLKMRGAFEDLFARGAEKIVLLGSDSPDLPPEFIAQTFAALREADLVFGPARDGGFYLIGASRTLPPSLFDNVPWSAPETLERTLDNAGRLGLSFQLVPQWDDVDDADDVLRLAWRLCRQTRGETHCQSAPQTRLTMNQYAMGLIMLTSVTLHDAKIELPDALTLRDGTKVTSAADWKARRRPELLELFRENIYGRAPVSRPPAMKFHITPTPDVMDGKATRKHVEISYEGRGGKGAIQLLMFVPKSDKPVPCFVFINNRGAEHMDATRAKPSPFWPAEQIVARGYAAAVFLNADVAADDKIKFYEGAPALFDVPGKRAPDAWGAIAAWAWGASRVMDYLQTDAAIDATRVAVVGHSRGGKAALWAGAEDERFAMTVSNNSGSSGAAIARGKQGEKIKDINTNFPHWFNANYKKFNDRENELPVDQHQLAALIAPRLLYITSASDDTWADPKAEFLAGIEAGPVYRLFGLKGLASDVFPKAEAPMHDGRIGYHLRTGKHGLTEYDWKCFMDFADRHLIARRD